MVPSLLSLMKTVKTVKAFLDAKEGNVVVLFCRTDKGRAGTLVASYLLYAGVCSTASDAMSEINATLPIITPSQRRFVKYVEDIMCGNSPFVAGRFPQTTSPAFAAALKLTSAALTAGAAFNSDDLKLEIIAPSDTSFPVVFSSSCSQTVDGFVFPTVGLRALKGDVILTVKERNKVLFRAAFNTLFICMDIQKNNGGKPRNYTLKKKILDGSTGELADQRLSDSDSFSITFSIDAQPQSNVQSRTLPTRRQLPTVQPAAMPRPTMPLPTQQQQQQQQHMRPMVQSGAAARPRPMSVLLPSRPAVVSPSPRAAEAEKSLDRQSLAKPQSQARPAWMADEDAVRVFPPASCSGSPSSPRDPAVPPVVHEHPPCPATRDTTEKVPPQPPSKGATEKLLPTPPPREAGGKALPQLPPKSGAVKPLPRPREAEHTPKALPTLPPKGSESKALPALPPKEPSHVAHPPAATPAPAREVSTPEPPETPHYRTKYSRDPKAGWVRPKNAEPLVGEVHYVPHEKEHQQSYAEESGWVRPKNVEPCYDDAELARMQRRAELDDDRYSAAPAPRARANTTRAAPRRGGWERPQNVEPICGSRAYQESQDELEQERYERERYKREQRARGRSKTTSGRKGEKEKKAKKEKKEKKSGGFGSAISNFLISASENLSDKPQAFTTNVKSSFKKKDSNDESAE